MYSFIVNSISNQGINFFQEQVAKSITNSLSRRVAVVALIALGCLAAIFFAGQCYLMCNEPSSPIEEDGHWFASGLSTVSRAFQEKIEDLEPCDIVFDSLEEEQKYVKTLKKNWLDDPKAEVQRIKDAKILTNSAEKRINQFSSKWDKDPIYMVVGRVLELKQIYCNTHYVFTHGQAPEVSIANQLIKEFVRAFTPLLHHPLKIPFRVPHTVTYTENAEDFINKYNANDDNFGYADNNHNAEMISVDACFWNILIAESALYFFDTASNINVANGNKHPLLKIFKSIFSHYLPDETLSEILADKACKIADQKKTETTVGTLYAICIPKAIVQDEKLNFAYRCHPFGRKCGCFPAADRIKVLEGMQANQFFTCNNGFMPQYRLLTSRLTEEKDVRSFAVDALPKERRKFYRNQIKDLVQEATKYSHLCDLIETLEEDPTVMDQIQSFIEDSPQLNPQYIQHLFEAKGLVYQ
jgi:hypothetical protein